MILAKQLRTSGSTVSVGTANSPGTSESVARIDHGHDHGAQTDPTQHALATEAAAGFLAPAEKTLLIALGAGVSGITASQHAALRTLNHWAAEGPFESYSGAYLETLPAAALFPTDWIWWVSNAKAAKLMDETVTYNSNLTVATQRRRVYDADGSTVSLTVTDTMTYSGVFELTRTRVIS